MVEAQLSELVSQLRNIESSSNSKETSNIHKLNILSAFNKRYENTFKFSKLDTSLKKQFCLILNSILSECWSYLNSLNAKPAAETPSDDSKLKQTSISLISSSLDTIRLVSRDTELIDLFENNDLLKIIQTIANLTVSNETLLLESLSINEAETDPPERPFSIRDREQLNVSALKAMSNLTYNSKFVQDFYVANDAAEAITIHLRLFTPAAYTLPNEDNKTNIMIFNLRILFLLTIFNKELRQQLSEKLQVILYLIEIIDQIMKERLSVNDAELGENIANASPLPHQSSQIDRSDYCYLKSIDVDYIIEILKILYNLTMDIPSVKANAASTMGQNNGSIILNDKSMHEEEEAHLMHLVSVLRDLMTCRIEHNDKQTESTSSSFSQQQQQHTELIAKLLAKQNELHSNIVNLLTNMPTICFEELMTPCIVNSPQASSVVQFAEPPASVKKTSFYSHASLNVRMAHNNKRNSRRSKRINKKNQKSSLHKILSSSEERLATNLDELKLEGSRSVNDCSSQHTCAPPFMRPLPPPPPSPALTSPLDSDLLLLVNTDEDLEFDGKNMEAISIVLSFMSRNVTSYLSKPHSYNADQLYPVFLLLSLMAKANKLIRKYCRFKILPPLNEKDLVHLPESGLTVRNRLVRLMTDPNMQLKRLCSQFLFILCKENVGRMVKHTGYGNAAGMLAEAGLMLSTHGDRSAYSSDSDDSDSEDYKKLEGFINPITGRAEIYDDFYVDSAGRKVYKPKRDVFEGMSEEQKEYEALQIVNAIDKLARMTDGAIKPATIGPDGRPVEIQHVLQLQEAKNKYLSNDQNDE